MASTLKMELSAADVILTSDALDALNLKLAFAHNDFGLDFLLVSVTASNAKHFLWKIETSGGNKLFTQIIDISGATSPRNAKMQFGSTAGFWTTSEFVAQRDIRDSIISLVLNHELTKIQYEFSNA